jgi:hypothetical protein
MTYRVLLAVGVAIAMGVLAPRASAQSADALKKAQAAFDQAQTDYLQGKYDEAARGFQDAYAARPFPQFLYNIAASYHMKGKKASDVDAYGKAVDFYKKYLQEDPNATDKEKVQKAISVLEDEIKRLKGAGTGTGSAAGSGSGSGSGSAAPAQAPSQEMQQLGDVKVHGLVVIVTEPQNATIYLDDKKKGVFGQTPWSGSLDGEHKIIIEKRGYKPVETTISADPSKLVQVISSLSQESYLGWIDITSNVPGSEVFMDDKTVGAIGKTPMSQNIKPGKHTFWITSEGYDEYTETVDVAAGETHAVKASLKGSPLGQLDVVGTGIEDATIYLDGKELCARGPCIRKVPEGDHKILVTRPDHKAYSQAISVQAKTEMTVKVYLQPQESHSDAIWAYAFTAIFAGGGIYAGTQANKLHDDLKNDIARGMPPPDSNDPRIMRGKLYAIGADVGFGLAAIAGLTAIYYTFRDKGVPSTGTVDVRALALHPEVGPGYAGLGVEVAW